MIEQKRIVLAVDGPAGSGKSSVCRRVAINMKMKYIDSGAIYRAITWYFLEKYGSINQVCSIECDLKKIDIEQIYREDGLSFTFVNGEDVSGAIREEKITENIGYFSDNIVIRDYVCKLLRQWAGLSSIIMDGRDIGTVVFPDAELKVYLDASVGIRTDRRVKEYLEMGKEVDELSVRNQIIQRDLNDKNRKVGGLKRAEDALYFDTSDMTFDEVVAKLENLVKDCILNMIKQ